MVLERLVYSEEVDGVLELIEVWLTELEVVGLNVVELEGMEVELEDMEVKLEDIEVELEDVEIKDMVLDRILELEDIESEELSEAKLEDARVGS